MLGFAALSDPSPNLPPPGFAEALHDVSNALTVLLGWLDEATRATTDPRALARALEIATRKAREAQALARAAITGDGDDLREQASLGAVLTDVAEALAPNAHKAGVSIAFARTDALDGFAIADGAATVHVLTNLVLNAVAYTPRGATVHIEVDLRADGGAAVVRVRDEGPGVSPSLADQLFDGASEREGGAGIGLRHSRAVLRGLGGDLVLTSGTRPHAEFAATIPRAAGRPSKAPTTRSAPSLPNAIAGLRVLVIEDDRAVCSLLDAGLGARGAEVFALHDGRDLENKLRGIGPLDAVLLDFSPIADDVEGALATVRRALPEAGIVFISGSVLAMPAAIEADRTRTRWVRKPFEIAEISEALAQLVSRG